MSQSKAFIAMGLNETNLQHDSQMMIGTYRDFRLDVPMCTQGEIAPVILVVAH